MITLATDGRAFCPSTISSPAISNRRVSYMFTPPSTLALLPP
jgi:hypothetical protein